MAISGTVWWELRSGGSDQNGGGFNISTATITDFATDSGTGNTNSPVVSSATYSFTQEDVGHYLYISGGTNWYPGWYRIASVSNGKATVEAAIGDAVSVPHNPSTARLLQPNKQAGVASVVTATGGSGGVDYSQADSPRLVLNDITTTAGSTTISSSTGFPRSIIGNLIFLSGSGVSDRFEVTGWINSNTVTLDRAVGADATDVELRLGGALGSANEALGMLTASGMALWVKHASSGYPLSNNPVLTKECQVAGYKTKRGERLPWNELVRIYADIDDVKLINFVPDTYEYVISIINLDLDGNNRSGVVMGVYDGSGHGWPMAINTRCRRAMYGIYKEGDGRLRVWDCLIDGNSSIGIRFSTVCDVFRSAVVGNGSDGIANVSSWGDMRIIDSIIAHNGGRGAHCAGFGGDAKNNSVFNNTSHGLDGGTGIGWRNCSNNIFYGNGGNGLWQYFGSLPHSASYQNNAVGNNTSGGMVMQYGSNYFTIVEPGHVELTSNPFVGPFYVRGASWQASTKKLTKTNGFPYAYAGAKVQVVAGTGITPGRYTIASVASASEIVLQESIGASDATDVDIDPIFELNDLPGGGRECKAAGFPGVFPPGTSNNYRDIGAIQHEDSGGAGAAMLVPLRRTALSTRL